MRNYILRIAIGLLFSSSVMGQEVTSSNTPGNDKWYGHVYNNNNFTNYQGYIVRYDTFIDWFYGTYAHFPVTTLTGGSRNVYTETFSVRYRMHSTKTGCYKVNFYGDDGIRLWVDGALVFNRWVLQGPTSYNDVLLNFTGNSNLMLDYFEQGGQNVVAFRNLVKLNDILSTKNVSLCPNSRSFINIEANALSVSGVSISYTYSWQVKEAGETWENIAAGGFNSETSCRITGIYNESANDKIFYFRRHVIFKQGARWGSVAKTYVDDSEEVKVVLRGLPQANITGGNVCEGNEILNFSALNSGVYNIILSDGMEEYSVTGLNKNDEINIHIRDGVLNYNIVVREIQQVGGCITRYSRGNEPVTSKAIVNVSRRIKTNPIIRTN